MSMSTTKPTEINPTESISKAYLRTCCCEAMPDICRIGSETFYECSSCDAPCDVEFS